MEGLLRWVCKGRPDVWINRSNLILRTRWKAVDEISADRVLWGYLDFGRDTVTKIVKTRVAEEIQRLALSLEGQ